MTPAYIVLSALSATAFEDDRKALKTVMKVLLSIFVAVLLLLGAVLEVLAYPEDMEGSLGEFKEQWGAIISGTEIAGSITGSITGDFIDQQAKDAAANIADPRRKAIIETAMSLVGKVPYFWGGKSAAGWNDDWNKPKLVTAAGSSSTGKYKPYGLDCSGFVDWVYRTAGIGDMLSPSPHGGIRGPWKQSFAIKESELLPGDLVIMYDPDKTTKVNHIGIFYGHDEKGKNLYIHCSSSGGGVVLNSFSGFKYWRRVPDLAQ